MPRCCKGDNPPHLVEGRHISITGTGTSQDPLSISATTAFDVDPSPVFNLVLEGDGSLEAPWRLRVLYASTSTFDDIPDVDMSSKQNGYVPSWNAAVRKWVAAPPAVVPAGSVSRGNGLTGDGSAQNPLAVVPNAARYIAVTTDGVGLSNAGVNALVRAFDTAAARTAASPPPIVGTLSVLGTNPDQLERWNGSTWEPVTGGQRKDIQTGQLLALSGGYAGGVTTTYAAQLGVSTDATGAFQVIPPDDLAGYSGVLTCEVQETGTLPWKAILRGGTTTVVGTAYRLDTGLPYTNAALSATVRALLY